MTNDFYDVQFAIERVQTICIECGDFESTEGSELCVGCLEAS